MCIRDRPWVAHTVNMEFMWIPLLRLWVGRFEVTNEEYQKKEPEHDSGEFREQPLNDPRQPVVRVNFDDCVAYAAWLTEQELSLIHIFARAGQKAKISLRKGVYFAGTGPTYETPAEIRAWRKLGADAVGMSTVPEAMLANATGLRVVGLSCITNMAAGILNQPLTHEEVFETSQKAMSNMKKLILQFWKELAKEKI